MSIDWQAIEDRLLAHSLAAIREFARDHSDELFSFFAYHAVYYEGYFQLCFDTLSNSLAVAQRTEAEAINRRAKMLSTNEAWRGAAYFTSSPAVAEYAQETGEFAWCLPAEIEFKEVHDAFVGGNYPGGDEASDEYIDGSTRIVLWQVLERLIAANAFDDLRLASPFRVGYQLSGDSLIVMRILNWPAAH